jgi:hypothetical protein
MAKLKATSRALTAERNETMSKAAEKVHLHKATLSDVVYLVYYRDVD